MFGVWSSLLVEFLGILLAGLTIKMMDDWLDVDYDQCIGKHTLVMQLGRACLPYALLCMGVSMALAPEVALALFLTAYAVGMGHDLREKMPTHLPGWIESLFVMAIAVWCSGLALAGWALFVMLTIQFLDDIMDLQQDRRSGQNNLVNRYGLVEVTLAMFISLLAAILIAPLQTVEVLVATPLVHIAVCLLSGGQIWQRRREEA